MRECSHRDGPDGPHSMRGLKGVKTTCDNSRVWGAIITDICRFFQVDTDTATRSALAFTRRYFEDNKEAILLRMKLIEAKEENATKHEAEG